MTWTQNPRIAFDLETTDRDPHQARIVTASIIHVEPDGTRAEEHDWLVDPASPIREPRET